MFTPGPAGSPTITITSGPDNGATVTDGNADYIFTVSDASSTVMCSLGDAAATTTSLYSCTSPQNFSGLPDGNYAFEIDAGNSFGTSTIMTDFMATLATPTTTGGGGSAPRQTTSPSTDDGNGQIVGSSPTAPSGAGSNAGGPPSGNTVIPTSDQPAIPEGTGSTAPANTSPSTQITEPTVSNSSGGSALVPTGVPVTTDAGIPNTGVDTGSSSDITPAASIASATPVAAAAASSGGGIPGWVWAVILLVILAALLWWAYSAGTSTDNPRV